MTNNRQIIEHDFIIPFRNNSYGVIIHWGGRMQTDENDNRLGLSRPYITLSRGRVNPMGSLENVEEVFELEIEILLGTLVACEAPGLNLNLILIFFELL